jgi:hypothetical protein
VRIAMGLMLACLLLHEAAGQDAKKKPTEPKVWMCLKGAPLWTEAFKGPDFPKDWHKGKGTWVLENGTIKGSEIPGDKHNTYMSHPITTPNVIIQFSFKIEGATWMGVSVNGKEHVAHLSFAAEAFKLNKVTGIGPTTKHTTVDSTKVKLADDAWHTAVWEINGDEMIATIDDKDTALAKADGLSMDRTSVELNNGGEWARFKDIRVWKAELDPRWPKKRAALIETLMKDPASLGYK